jgi:hypothetical protein
MKPFARSQQEAAFRLDRNPVLPFTWRRVQKVRGLCDLLSISSCGDVTGVMRGSSCSARAGRCAGDERGFRS